MRFHDFNLTFLHKKVSKTQHIIALCSGAHKVNVFNFQIKHFRIILNWMIYIIETLQLILRKIHKMRFFLWLSVFLLHRWKYKLSENNTTLKLKIIFLSQKLIIFCGLINKYCCHLLFFLWHTRRKQTLPAWLMMGKTYGVKTK